MTTKPIRPPAVAGAFYPRQSSRLNQLLDEYLEAAEPPLLAGVRAIIAPHAGYVYSGPVAAFAYALLSQQALDPARCYLLGPAHRAWFKGVALADYAAFETPLGTVAVDQERVQCLAESGTAFQILSQAHDNEHCLEVQLPFLQRIYPDVPIVPLLFGDVAPQEVARVLNAQLEPEALLIISSDLSHYHPYDQARHLDRDFLDAVLEDEPHRVLQGEACGQGPIAALMYLARERAWKPHLLDYRTSGDTAGDRSQVVGYAALAYTEESL